MKTQTLWSIQIRKSRICCSVMSDSILDLINIYSNAAYSINIFFTNSGLTVSKSDCWNLKCTAATVAAASHPEGRPISGKSVTLRRKLALDLSSCHYKHTSSSSSLPPTGPQRGEGRAAPASWLDG